MVGGNFRWIMCVWMDGRMGRWMDGYLDGWMV